MIFLLEAVTDILIQANTYKNMTASTSSITHWNMICAYNFIPKQGQEVESYGTV